MSERANVLQSDHVELLIKFILIDVTDDGTFESIWFQVIMSTEFQVEKIS